MDTLKQNFDNTVRQRFGQTIEALESAFKFFNLDYYLIGAFVREVWTDHVTGLPVKRATNDLDFAIYINKLDQYDNLKVHLVEKEKFTLSAEPYRILSPNGGIVDLIPFGSIENNNEVELNGVKPFKLSVFGTREVTENARIIEGNFKVITLPGLCIMKLISWNESPGRQKDIDDFYYVLLNYSNIVEDNLFQDENLTLLEQYDDMRIVGAKILGREMNQIIDSSSTLKSQLREILHSLLQKFKHEDIDQMFKEDNKDIHIVKLKLVKELLDSEG
jgi:predicted nucleotidyltransferase